MRSIALQTSLICSLFLLTSVRPVAAGLVFDISTTGNALADDGFQKAADFIVARFSDDVTVRIDAGFSDLGVNILGGASSVKMEFGFSNWKTAIADDVTSADDATMVAGLPAGSTFTPYISNTTDGAAAHLSTTAHDKVRLSRAQAKAIGLVGAHASSDDATITFNNHSSITFDFNPDDGITSGQIDFVGVAIHELLHAMGFFSGADIVDINPESGTPTFPDSAFNGRTSAMDFTRSSADSRTAGADVDITADTRTKDYSLNGGSVITVANAFSTGIHHGDGRQASHWRDNAGLGILDPTAAPAGFSTIDTYTALDAQAMDILGWDLAGVSSGGEVPEPASVLLWTALSTFGLFHYRRKKRAA